MRSPVALVLMIKASAFFVLATALQIRSNNPAFQAAGRQGCISGVSNTDGASVVIQNCNGQDAIPSDWQISLAFGQNTAPQQLRVFGDKCLDVLNGLNADGTLLQLWTCSSGNTNQLWTYRTDNTLQWAGTNKCIDLSNGVIDNGSPLQIWTCDSENDNQGWTVSSGSSGTTPAPPVTVSAGLRLLANAGPSGSAAVCLTASNNADGAAVSLAFCNDRAATFPAGNGTWILPAAGTTGSITTYNGAKCLDVRDGSSANGNTLQVWTCASGNTNQLWSISGSGSNAGWISWAGQNKCLDVKDGNFATGGIVQLWDCSSGNSNQLWVAAA
ncbi:hypothetical protein V5O48_011091 [Marasmius crinis-equi]|uniref:Ricin B lectin domain-containing protein n=1 Tax=Marasmius crinis-equi TaxID=585013 RepID=A0ABR3F719_9AGAR